MNRNPRLELKVCRNGIGVAILIFLLLGCSRTPTPVSNTSGAGDLDVEMWASNGCVQVGDTVHLRATVTNRGSKTQVIELNDKPVLDINFGNLDTGHRWSEGKPLTPDLTRLELAPGASKSIEIDWVVERIYYGGVGISAIFNYDDKGDRLTPGVTVNVAICPSPLGP